MKPLKDKATVDILCRLPVFVGYILHNRLYDEIEWVIKEPMLDFIFETFDTLLRIINDLNSTNHDRNQ